MVYNRQQIKMKKILVLSSLLAAAIAFVAFVPKQESNVQPLKTELSSSYVSTVSVCHVFGPGRLDKDCRFVGKYDSESNYIKIYLNNGLGVRDTDTPVATGTPQRNDKDNWSSNDQRSNYSYCLNNKYFFNL